MPRPLAAGDLLEPSARYLDADGKVPRFECVRQALDELRLPAQTRAAADATAFADAAGGLVFGDGRDGQDPRRFLTHPAASGTHALALGARLLADSSACRRVYLPAPSWSNHQRIFEQAGFTVGHYPYFDAYERTLDVASLVGFLCRQPQPGIIVLQASCHNPTGCDLTRDQWDTVADVIKAMGHIPFIDMAYQGLGDTIDEDNYGVTAMVSRGLYTLVAQSYSKILQLPDARCGSLSAHFPTVDSGLALRRALHACSAPDALPCASVPVVTMVLSQPRLRQLWQEELAGVRNRMAAVRATLHKTLCRLSPAWDWSYLNRQRGYFSYDPALQPDAAGNPPPGGILSASGRLGISLIAEPDIPQIASAIATACLPFV